MIMRQTSCDVEVDGVPIPAGSTITCMLAAANRDPRKFSDPDTFDIFRTDNDTSKAFTASADHLAFIDGRHFCVGAMLARNEVDDGDELPPRPHEGPPAAPTGSRLWRRASSPAPRTTSR